MSHTVASCRKRPRDILQQPDFDELSRVVPNLPPETRTLLASGYRSGSYNRAMSVLRCIHCNYQLQQISATRCPECGIEFDVANRLTVNHGRELTPVARWSLAPGGAIAALALLAAAGGAAWLARLPPGVNDRTMINGALVILMGAIWLSWPAVRRWSAKRNGWQTEWFVARRVVRRWPGLVAVIIGVAILLGIPRWIAFRVSERSLGQIAETLMNSRRKAPDQWAGVFHATSILRVRGGVIITTSHEKDGVAGFEYLPFVDPKDVSWTSRQYLADGWWAWQEPR